MAIDCKLICTPKRARIIRVINKPKTECVAANMFLLYEKDEDFKGRIEKTK